MDVKCKDIHYSIGEKKILNGVSLEVKGGQFQTILGPNGSGKSTLLKTIYRQLKPDSGQILLDGKSLDQVSLKETAKEMAVVTQFNTLQFDCTVEEIVMLGRTPHLSFLQKESERDHLLVQDALDKVGMSEKKTRYYSSLSGGEKQRVILARALAQEPKLLLLDEPTNHLDIKYQLEMLALVKELAINVLAVLHDIQLACRFSDYIYLMKGGEIVAQGVPRADFQLSLAIGKEGQNARLAAKLTGFKIDIKSESQAKEEGIQYVFDDDEYYDDEYYDDEYDAEYDDEYYDDEYDSESEADSEESEEVTEETSEATTEETEE